MNKKQFLDLLEKKLSVLEENEKQDIIIEYTDTINEKVKKGQTEEEAVKDFGDIEDLTAEILKAYKINPNYEDKKDSISKKGEEIIKQSAEAVSGLSRKVAKKCNITSKDISLEFIVEIIIRIFIVLIAALVLKGIFTIFSGIGETIFDNFYDPVGSLFILFWNLLLVVMYILICALMIFAIFKKYFKLENSKEPEITEEKEETKEETKKQNLNNNKPKKQVKPNKNKGTTLGGVCLLIVKIFVIIYVIVPFIFIDGLILFGLVLSIIYLVKGINLIGLVLLLLGMGILFTYLIKLLFSLLFGKGKASIIPVIISIVLMIIGTILFVDMVMNIDYIESQPNEKDQITETKTFTANKKVFIHFDPSYNNEINEIVDNQMPDGQFTMSLKYGEGYHEYNIEEDQNYLMNDCEYSHEIDYYDYEDDYEDEYEDYQECTQSTYYYINIYDQIDHSGFNEFKDNYKNIIEDLKEGKIYNKENLYQSKLTITANQKTLDMIKTNQ